MIEKDPVKKLTDEILSITNQETYQKILNMPLTKEKSDYIENSYRFMKWLEKK